MDDDDIFSLRINDGAYNFRNLFHIISKETEKISIILKFDSIFISFRNKSKTAVHNVKIDVEEIAQYYYNPRDDNGDIIPEYAIGVYTKDLQEYLSKIGQKDSIKIRQPIDDDQLLYLQIIKPNSDPNQDYADFVNILNIEHKKFNLPKDIFPETPTARILAVDFSTISKNCTKCSGIEFIKIDYGVAVRSLKDGGNKGARIFTSNTTKQIAEYKANMEKKTGTSKDTDLDQDDDDCDLPDIKNLAISTPSTKSKKRKIVVKKGKYVDKKELRIEITKDTFRHYSKIQNICQRGTKIKIYMFDQEKCPHSKYNYMKFVTPIGFYGVYEVIILSKKD